MKSLQFAMGIFFLGFGPYLLAGGTTVEESYFVVDPMNRNGAHSPVLESFILDPELIIDHVSPEGFEVYGAPGLGTRLRELQLDIRDLSPFERSHSGATTVDKASVVADYPSPEIFARSLKSLAQDNPGFLRLSSIGQSVKGRDIQMVRLGSPKASRKVFLGANIHGNEITGREILGLLIEDLTAAHRAGDRRVTDLLQQVEVFVVPSINPDGMARTRRGNGNSVDLNRNFPDNSRGEPNTEDGREPEVQALMRVFAKHNISLAVSFHGGAQVVNYPWDNTRADYPHLQWIQSLSREYVVESRGYMESSQFPDGTVRGYDWYPTYGNFQDWSCHYYGSHHVQIELSDVKWPRYSEMKTFYEWNRPALFSFLTAAVDAP